MLHQALVSAVTSSCGVLLLAKEESASTMAVARRSSRSTAISKYALNWTRLSWPQVRGQPRVMTMAVHLDQHALQPGQLYALAGVPGGYEALDA